MNQTATPPNDPAAMPFSRLVLRRVFYTLLWSTGIGLLVSMPYYSPVWLVVLRTWCVGLAALAAFTLLERWPQRLPGWAGRWVLQLVGIVVVVPITALALYWFTTSGPTPFWTDQKLANGYRLLVFAGIFFAPWIALGTMVRQREAHLRLQKLAFEVERASLERRAQDARMHLLQAQIQPHFLFNTLANVQALVDTGSPQASRVLAALIAYLRAAVPRLDDPVTTLRRERDLVRAYLELMHLRMPDRLRWSMQVDPEALDLRCPPLTLLTLVENAVRHGIDPSEEGGSIDIRVACGDGRCRVRVSDTGVGLQDSTHGSGTGLVALRERLQMTFDGDASLVLTSVEPHGVSVELDFPAQRSTP